MPDASFFAEGNEQYLTRWLKEYLEEDYLLHATVRAGETAETAIQRADGGALRIPDGSDVFHSTCAGTAGSRRRQARAADVVSCPREQL